MKIYERYWCWALFSWAALMLWASGADWTVGPGCSLFERLAYPFCHTSVWHMLANVWAGWVISNSDFRDTPSRWALSLLIAWTVPAVCGPAMGMSGVLYALMGQLSWQSLDRRRFHLWCLGFMALGLLFPTRVGNMLHLYCYVLGVMLVGVKKVYDDFNRWV